jgi:hypothetical protein
MSSSAAQNVCIAALWLIGIAGATCHHVAAMSFNSECSNQTIIELEAV